MNKRLLLLLLLPWGVGCVPQPTKIPDDERKPISEMTLPEVAAPESARKVLLYVVHSEGDAEKLIDLLEKSPTFRPTLIFPGGYFSNEQSTAAVARFKALQSAGRIEIALTL